MRYTVAVAGLIAVTLYLSQYPTNAQDSAKPQVISLWERGAPGFEARKDEPEKAESYWVKNVHNPSITAFLPPKDKANGAAVVICPGGGHRELVFNAEGVDAAKFFNDLGVAAFVLKYRLGREPMSPYKIDVHALEDGQRAMRLVRHKAGEWGIDPKRIGMMGFSAGGEVVSMVCYGSHDGKPDATDPVDKQNCRPDFQIMIYAGPLGIPKTIAEGASPAFLLVANDDRGAIGTMLGLAEKLRAAKTPIELHVLAKGGHGFNMGNRSKLVSVNTWPKRLEEWLVDSGYLEASKEDASSK